MRCLLATTVQVSPSWLARVIRNDAVSPEMLQNVQETLKQILAETNRQSDLIHHFDAWQAGRNNR